MHPAHARHRVTVVRFVLTLLLTLFLAATSIASEPADAVLLAWRDALRLAPEDRHCTRYLWLSENETKLNWIRWAASAGHVNGLSLGRRIVAPAVVFDDLSIRLAQTIDPNDWARAVLIRVNLRYYQQTAEQWDKLGDPSLEPFFHAVTKIAYPAGQYTTGEKYPAGFETKVVPAPWLFEPINRQPKARMDLYRRAATELGPMLHAKTPIVEARNFIWQTAIDFDRKAGYYSWLGIKDKKTFDALVRVDNKTLPLVDAVSDSGVTQEPRLIERLGRGDGYWQTKDQVNQRAQGNRNPLVIQKKFKFDAFEIFGRLDNGWWATGLFTDQGKIQQSAPDGIGYHHGSLTNDGRIHVYLTCFVCHDKKEGSAGLHPFRPYFRSAFAAPGPLGVFSFKDLKGVEEQYLTPFDSWADVDRRIYINAVYQATGMSPHQWSVALYDTFHNFDQPVTLSDAAREIGLSDQAFVAALQQYLVNYGQLDTVNANWLVPEERRSRINRNQWTEAYPLAQLAVRQLPTWPPPGKEK